MRKCLLLVALLTGWLCTESNAQLFVAPDTVCINQPVRLVSNTFANQSYYWGFCSGYLPNTPVAANLGNTFGFTNPSAIEVTKDGNNYYAFVLSRGSDSLFRLSFGSSLGNTPTVTNFGNLSGTVPQFANALHIVKDSNRWFLFASGGSDATNSSLARFDFGPSLSNSPNSVNFGNLGGLLNHPEGIFVSLSGSQYYGYAVNNGDNDLIRFDFGGRINLTPTATRIPNPAGFAGPTDIGVIRELNGDWVMLVTNGGDNTLSRLQFGPSLGSFFPVGTNLGSLGSKLFGPSGISIVRDCGGTYAFVTNQTTNELVRVNIPSLAGTYTADNLGNLGGNAFAAPSDISNVVRQRDTLFAFSVNSGNSQLTALLFPQCTSSTIASSDSAQPPVYEYTVPGLYNVYLAVDEGLPTMRVECQQIRALPIPGMTLSNDTLICQGDTINLIAQVAGALSYTWSPNYNISDTTGIRVRVFPEYSTGYLVVIPFANGCIIDTVIRVNVSKNRADAGPDRVIGDGSNTTLGGPFTTLGPEFTYEWIPNQFLSDGYYPFPSALPPYDLTYVLKVSNTTGCIDYDTVVVRTACTELYLPNAFAPSSGSTTGSSTFGIRNRQIVQLNYFRVYDRWGKLMFETTDPTKEWDGTYNGEMAPMAVYVWDADGFCAAGRRLQKSGNVTLIR